MTANKLTIFIDFDDVLMRTRDFKIDYFGIFEKFGISSREAKRAYLKIKENIGRDEPLKYLLLLKKKHPNLPLEKIKNPLYLFRGKSKNYLFADAKAFLQKLKKLGYRLELVTSGNVALQKKKVFASGLSSYFARTHFVKSDYKGYALQKIFGRRREPFIFIDDRLESVESVKKIFPNSLVIQLLRYSNQKKSKLVDRRVSNLKEVFNIIKDVKT